MVKISVTSFILALSLLCGMALLFFLNMLFIANTVSFFSIILTKWSVGKLLCTTIEMYKLHSKMIENTSGYVISYAKFCFR